MSTGIRQSVAKWSKIIQFWLLPGICVLCRRHSGRDQDLCLDCESLLKPAPRPCRTCGLALPPGDSSLSRCGPCLLHKAPMARTLAPFAWEDPTSGLISGFKYQAKLPYGRVLSELLARRLRSAYQDAPLPDLLLPVPLHWRKLLSRGFNQSLLIARHLERELNIPVAGKLVRRIRNTPAQKGLRAEQRKRNLRQAFVVDAARLALLPSGTRIALVDDVVTTMSTAKALCSALQASSAVPLEFHLWALARA